MTLFIGIDLGTSGCRALARDERGEVHGRAAVALPAPECNGASRQQAPHLWWEAVNTCLESLRGQIPMQEVTALAVDGTSATLLLTDADGEPLGPALMYNDARATAQAQRIAARAPADTAAQGPACALAKLLWLQDEGLAGDARHALHQADWIAARLSGRLGVSDVNNALKLGYDPVADHWPAWLDALEVPRHLLPTVVAPGTPLGTLSPQVAQRFGLPAAAKVVAGTTDSTAAFLATGADAPGEAVTCLGSTLVLKVIAEQPVFAAEYGIYSQPLMLEGKRRWLVGGASNSGGAVLRQFFNDEEMQALTPRLRPARRTCLEYYPLPSRGERFPVNDPQLAPRLHPRPFDDARFFQALLEGLTRIEARGYRLLAELGAPYPVSVRTTGGGAVNAAWTRMRQLALGIPVTAAVHTEAAYGAAKLAMEQR
jgi:sugar (pentulose or hexulose) kinase